MPDERWLADNLKGVGRIRREAYQLHIGDVTRDIDELRVHLVHNLLEPMLAKLTHKITALECLWISQIFSGTSTWENNRLMEMLVKLCR